ncbi:hypothetical protein Tco_0374507 [Tanacetum coccineum]
MRALLIQHRCEAALEVLPANMEAEAKAELKRKLTRNCPKNNRKKSIGYVKKADQLSSSGSIYDGSEVMSAEALLDWIMDSEGSYHMTPRIVLSGTRRDNCVYSLDGHVVEGAGKARAVWQEESRRVCVYIPRWKVQIVEAVSRESDWEDG